jgi:hypothetical protein
MPDQTFTSWKLDWINALSIGTRNGEFLIGVALLQHADATTRIINPSQARLAYIFDCSVRSIERAISALVARGVMKAVRRHRQTSNHYRFVDAWKDEMLAIKAARESELKQKRRISDPTDLSGREHEVLTPDPTELTGLDPTDLSGKHLSLTPARRIGT